MLRRELSEQRDILSYFKKLPVDIKYVIQSYYKSTRPSAICPMCARLHYPFFCAHYCQPECYAIALKQMIWYHNVEDSYSSENEQENESVSL